MGAAFGSLPVFKIAIGGGDAARPGRDDILIDADTHRTTGISPLKTRGAEIASSPKASA